MNMLKKMIVALNETRESSRALTSGIALAKLLQADLRTVTVMRELPAYTAYAVAADPAALITLREQRRGVYEALQKKAQEEAKRLGVELTGSLLEGSESQSIVAFLIDQKADLLIIGLHQRDLYLSRLWSTVYSLAQGSPCSVLGIH